MTRQVQVGGTLPPGFGRHQRGYTSLPPNRRHPQQPPQYTTPVRGENGSKTVTRRASVAGDVAGSRASRTPASNPSTPEKLLEKEKKSSKREKDKDKKKKDTKDKDKDREKENKDSKSEKSPKKKWFWTLPLRRKKKTKDEAGEDDDGGFKAASEKGTRKLAPPTDTSFVRYPSPDTTSSDINSSQSSEMSIDYSSYRSSPSSEVNYYSQRAQFMQHQQQAQQQHLLQLQHQQHQQLLQQQLAAQQQQQLLQQQQHLQQNAQQSSGNLRSLPTTPIAAGTDAQGSFVSSSPLAMNSSDITDLTVTDRTRTRQYMSRDEMYSAMRHPQYYNYNRHSYAGGSSAQLSDEANNNNSTPSSRSTSPAVFGVNPLPSNTVRPQVRERFISAGDDYVSRESQDTPIPFIFKENGFDDLHFGKVEPPAGYGESENGSTSSDGDDNNHDLKDSSGNNATSANSGTGSSKSISKQTTLFDFKKMILQQSMQTAGGKERISAVEMLRASRPSIYGYAPPPAPIIKPSHLQQQQQLQQMQQRQKTTIEGVIMPPTSRNTARALLFQSRFGSGRRFRASKTDIISTTILEDHGGEVSEEADMEEESDEEDEDSEGSSPDRTVLQSSRGPLSRTFSEPGSAGVRTPTASPNKEAVVHSTPNPGKGGEMPPIADVSQIEVIPSNGGPGTLPPEESMETAL